MDAHIPATTAVSRPDGASDVERSSSLEGATACTLRAALDIPETTRYAECADPPHTRGKAGLADLSLRFQRFLHGIEASQIRFVPVPRELVVVPSVQMCE